MTPPLTDVAHADRLDWLKQFQLELQQQRDLLHKRELGWSWGRLLLFLTAAGAWLVPELATGLKLGGCALGLVAFGYAVKRHRRAERQRMLADDELVVVGESISRLNEGVVLVRSHDRPVDADAPAELPTLPITVGEIASLTQQERDDLDIYFSPVGLFGLLNRTSTIVGARRLRDMIEQPCLGVQDITVRREAVGYLDQQAPDRMKLMGSLVALRSSDAAVDRTVSVIANCEPLPGQQRVRLLRVWGLVSALYTALTVIMAAVGQYSWCYPLVLLLVANGFLLWRIKRVVSTAIEPWGVTLLILQRYCCAAECGAETLPESGTLGMLRKHLRAASAKSALPTLINRVSWTGSGGMFHQLCNLVLFWDLHVADGVLSCASSNRGALLNGLAAVAELEALTSLACFAWETPDSCYAEPGDVLDIEDGWHPLIPRAAVVANSVRLDRESRVWIVTGSNMSGKSTLLRMVGCNVLLAQIGTVSLAKSMVFKPVRLITDLRATDSLADSESYFLAEVRHVKRMVFAPHDGVSCLGLIDEPFRGTNSDEQEAASLAVAEHLLASGHLFIIATHDRRLTELGAMDGVVNHHFSEDLDGDGLVFDYVCRTGPAKSRNALRVLEREGYPAALVARARQWYAQSEAAAGAGEAAFPLVDRAGES